MQFKKFTVVEVVMTFYLSTGFWCHYIPEKKIPQPNNKSKISARNSEQIQMCGNQLTNLIIEACDGFVGSLSEGAYKGVHSKITEECCDNKCPLDYLQSYCGQTPLFATKERLKGKLSGNFQIENQSRGVGGKVARKDEMKTLTETKKKPQEVRTEKLQRKAKGKKGRKKKKRSFKWKCAFKSFGHFLLKLDRKEIEPTNNAKKNNKISRAWPSIQVGTISPEIDKFGGRPTVVVKRNKSNFV